MQAAVCNTPGLIDICFVHFPRQADSLLHYLEKTLECKCTHYRCLVHTSNVECKDEVVFIVPWDSLRNLCYYNLSAELND